jgi:hypothetical protein
VERGSSGIRQIAPGFLIVSYPPVCLRVGRGHALQARGGGNATN